LAAELKAAFPDVELKMIPSGGGVFDVKADEALVFSKKAAGRHAEPGEVVRLLRERAGQL
jgi:selenoprotein W-related protein